MTDASTFSLRRGLDLVPILVVLVAAIALWPARFGGATTLVVVRGDSMEPDLSSGDLAVVRASSRYDVGDVVAFRIPSGSADGRLVIHRIVDSTDDGFVTRGDNRAGDDPWRPTRSDIVGRVVVAVPGLGGQVLGALPWVSSLLIGLGGAIVLWARFGARPSRSAGGAGAPIAPWPPPVVPDGVL